MNKENTVISMNEKILLVEDNVMTREALTDILGFKDYEVFPASDGEEAMETLDKVLPDLILTDIMMPNMNGYELYEAIRKDEKFDNIPIIFLTAKVSREDIIKGKKLGVDDYITKPVDIDELLASIQGKLQRANKVSNK